MHVGILGYAYWKVTAGVQSLNTMDKLLPPILMGIVSTILIFWSLSGFILRIVQSAKGIYLKDTNMFVLRQLNNKINTTVISMSVICLMLFMTISVLSTSIGIRNTMQKELVEMTPVDINLYKTANLPEKYTGRNGKVITYTEEQRAESKRKVSDTLKSNNFDMNLLKDTVEIEIYCTNELTLEKFFGDKIHEVRAQFAMISYDTTEEIIKISDYNKIARLYGIEEYDLNPNEYIVLCNFSAIEELRNKVLEKGENILTIAGKEYKSKYNKCQNGYVKMAGSHVNTGIILVPDECNLTEEMKEQYFLVANYNAKTDEEKQKIDEMFSCDDSNLIQNLANNGFVIDGSTKISIIESSVGLATIITFIAIYLGIIFLIASSAILALKQLTESSDNKQRYTILRKIGCDEKMINKALFRQIGIFFLMPLVLAIIHSVFGIKFAMSMMVGLADENQLLPSIVTTVAILGVIYGAYFIATYLGSKSVIREE